MLQQWNRMLPVRAALPILCSCVAAAVACGQEPVDTLAAGADIPIETAAELLERPDVYLVDVRTEAEFAYVGHPTGAVNIPLLRFDPESYGTRPNPDFVEQVKGRFAPDDTLLMICRSGGRSARAARMLADAGYTKVYNVLEGVEGETDDAGHRTVNGWKVRGLPFEYKVHPEEITPLGEEKAQP